MEWTNDYSKCDIYGCTFTHYQGNISYRYSPYLSRFIFDMYLFILIFLIKNSGELHIILLKRSINSYGWPGHPYSYLHPADIHAQSNSKRNMKINIVLVIFIDMRSICTLSIQSWKKIWKYIQLWKKIWIHLQPMAQLQCWPRCHF